MTLALPPKFSGRAALSPDEAAEVLGLKRATFYRRVMPYVYTGRIQSVKLGGCRRIIASSLLSFLNEEAIHGT